MFTAKTARLLSTIVGIIALLSTFPLQAVSWAEQFSESSWAEQQAKRNATVEPDALALPKILERSWKPSIEFAGNGDKSAGVDRLRKMQQLQQTMLKNSDFHEQTHTFINDLWASFEHFNLKRFHKILPEEDGEWRKLSVVGHLDNDVYKYGPTPSAVNARNAQGTPQDLGDFSVEIRAKEIENKIFGVSFLIESDINVGLGSADWTAIRKATKETIKIVVDGDSRFTSDKSSFDQAAIYRDKVKAMNKHLDSKDIAIIAPLWASFPNMWELLSKVAKVEDVVVIDIVDKPYKQLQTSLSIQPQKMKLIYPKLAKFLRKIGPLFNVKVDLNADEGRYIRAEIDSKTLTIDIEAYVKDGQILPQNHRGGIALTVPNKKPGEPWNFVAVANAELQILGVKANMTNIRTKIDYTTQEKGANIDVQVNEMPKLEISGRALGILPTSFIDIMMPSNLEKIMSAFLAVIFEGENGKGIMVNSVFNQATDERVATVQSDVSFVGLDNIFMRIGMGIVNDRIIPEDNVSVEIRQLWFDTQHAFSNDLKNFEVSSL